MRAPVRQTGRARHLVHGAEPVDLASQIAWVELETEELAKAQARFESAIEAQDWIDAEAR